MTDSFVVTSIVPVMHFSFLLPTCRYTKACMAAVFSLERLWIFLTFQKYICLPICLSVCACCLPICVSVCLAVCAWHLPICLSVSSVNHLAVFLSSVWCVFLYVCLLCISIWSVGLFVCLKDCEWTVPNLHRLVSVSLLFLTHRTSGLTLQLTLWMVRVWTSPCVVLIPSLLVGEPLRAWVLGWCTSLDVCMNCSSIVLTLLLSILYCVFTLDYEPSTMLCMPVKVQREEGTKVIAVAVACNKNNKKM